MLRFDGPDLQRRDPEGRDSRVQKFLWPEKRRLSSGILALEHENGGMAMPRALATSSLSRRAWVDVMRFVEPQSTLFGVV